MVLYVAIVAILNLGLGYGLAVYVGAGRKPRPVEDVADYESDYDYDSSDDYGSYERDRYETEIESRASV